MSEEMWSIKSEYAALDVTYVKRDTYYSPSPFKGIPSCFIKLKTLMTKNCDLLLIETTKRPTDQ